MADGNVSNVVVDEGKWVWSEMWTKEDWWVIWLGCNILAIGMIVYFPHSGDMKAKIEKAEAQYSAAANRTSAIKTIAWYKLSDGKKKDEARKIPAGKWLAKLSGKPKKWSSNPLDSFMMGETKANAKVEKAKVKYEKKKAVETGAFAAAEAAEAAAEAADFKDEGLNAAAAAAISKWRDAKLIAGKAKKSTGAKPYNLVGMLILLGIIACFFFGIPMIFMGQSFSNCGVFADCTGPWCSSRGRTF